jgi:hypothetical protein
MTVKQLREALEGVADDVPVHVIDQRGYCYSPFRLYTADDEQSFAVDCCPDPEEPPADG